MNYDNYPFYQYAINVVEGRIVANRYVIAQCQIFLDDLKKQEDDDFQWYFDIKTYHMVDAIRQLFCFADGMYAGQPMVLADFQNFIVANLFCWKHKQDGFIRYNKSYIQIARKNGKSFLLGFITIMRAFLYEYGTHYVTATKRDQAKIVVNEIKKLLDKATAIKKHFRIYSNLKMVCNINKSTIEPLSSDARTTDGLFPDTAIVDEYGAHRDNSLYSSMLTGQMTKPNAIICVITTAYPNAATSPAKVERDYVANMLDGKMPMNDRYFGMLFELDEEDDYNDEDVWAKANPLISTLPIALDKMRSDYNDGLADSSKMQLFRTKNLNQWLYNDENVAYVDYKEWEKCQTDKVSFRGKEVVIGIDLSKTTDLCGITMMAREGKGYILKSFAWLPKAIVGQKETMDKLPYSSYLSAKKDWLHATEGKFVNQKEIEDFINNIEEQYECTIKSICFDSWGALHLMSSLSNTYEVIDVRMSYKMFSPVIKKFRELILENKIQHEYNPILNFCVANATTKQDSNENILLDKQKSTNRIDLLVSSCIAYSDFLQEDIEEEYDYDVFII